MRVFKTIFTISILLITTISLKAQSATDLLGKWKSTYEYEGQKGTVIYTFKNENGKLKAYAVLETDDKGNSKKMNTLTLDKISFKNGKGKGKYHTEYDGKNYELKATLTLQDDSTLKVYYSTWGYSDTEIWKRQNQ